MGTHTKHIVFALVSVLVILWGCQRTPSSPEPSDALVINMLVKADVPRQTAMVTKVLGNEDFGSIYVNNAFVYLNENRLFNQPKSDRLTDRREFNYEEDYNYYSPSIFISPGQTCTLMAYTADGDTVFGETNVPERVYFRIETGKSPFNFPEKQQQVPVLEWGNSPDTYMYMLNIYKPGLDVDRVPVYTGKIVFNNELRLTPDIFNPKVIYIFELIQFDKNYYDYIIQEKDIAGITGGRGVFGSMTVQSFRYLPPKE